VEVIYSAIEGSVLVAALFAVIQLSLALVGSYLIVGFPLQEIMIKTAAIWILFPAVIATFALFLRHWRWLSWGMTLFTSALLTGLAFFLPMQGTFQWLFLKISLQDVALFFGREFILGESERMMLVLLYGSLAFWLVPIPFIRGARQFPAIGLGLVSIFTAVIAIRPFLFAALLIECAVLLCFPLLTPLGSQVNKGLLRWLSQVSLSLPCILYSGWALSRVELASTAPQIIIRAALLMGVGFIFLLGIFPFHSFLPMMLKSLPPYITTYVLFLYTTFVSLFGIALINQFTWLKESSSVHIIIAAVGSFMIMLSGLLGATQNHYGRLLSYVLLSEIGYSLLAIGVSFEVGLARVLYPANTAHLSLGYDGTILRRIKLIPNGFICRLSGRCCFICPVVIIRMFVSFFLNYWTSPLGCLSIPIVIVGNFKFQKYMDDTFRFYWRYFTSHSRFSHGLRTLLSSHCPFKGSLPRTNRHKNFPWIRHAGINWVRVSPSMDHSFLEQPNAHILSMILHPFLKYQINAFSKLML
jgi:hypothetical protein